MRSPPGGALHEPLRLGCALSTERYSPYLSDVRDPQWGDQPRWCSGGLAIVGIRSWILLQARARVLWRSADDCGYHTASISSFPLRHSAPWWTSGFLESMNLMRGYGGERADEVPPGALDWLERRGRANSWFLHVHFWDPYTPYNAPEEFGNPFASGPVPS